MQINRPKGTKDILPADCENWRWLESEIHKICAEYNYGEIRTPVFEHTELFNRGAGSTSDVVEKEMYTFRDKGERSLTLRPEGTASVARAFLENSLYAEALPKKLYYMINCYRYEKPQEGRYREFRQFGAEVLGSESASLDAEVIALSVNLIKRLGANDVTLCINSIGCPHCRAEYNKLLAEYLNRAVLCKTCRERLHRNPLRILDCKNDSCKTVKEHAPKILDHLCGPCREHFDEVRAHLKAIGLEYVIDPYIVRGLDYYTRTVFELVSPKMTILGGGRYDGLVEELDGPKIPGVGFALGLERIIEMLASREKQQLTIFVVQINSDTEALKLVEKLRAHGIRADKDYLGRSLKAQMKYADKLNAKYSLVLGEDEVNTGIVKVKNMGSGETDTVTIDDLAKFLREE